mmetsp:Transcript_55787/g.120558  ORF Transcript_55787/g.120558 Transcript_55787/m.120558 type:complete len:323 (+) Transcript_55787:372-1340(+)
MEAMDVVSKHLSLELLVQVIEARNCPVAAAFDLVLVHTTSNLEPATLAPVGAPGVASHPVLQSGGRLAPASDFDDVVNGRDVLVGDEDALVLIGVLRVVLHELHVRGHAACDGPSGINLLHHGFLTRDPSIVGDAEASPGLDGPAGLLEEPVLNGGLWSAVPADPLGLADAILGLVRHAGLIGHAVVLQIAVDLIGVSTVAARGGVGTVGLRHAVHERLSREHDVREGTASEDLDSVVQSCCRAVNPAGSAILRDVLVDIASDKALAVHAAPVEDLRQRQFADELHATWRCRRRPGNPFLRAHEAVVHVQFAGSEDSSCHQP